MEKNSRARKTQSSRFCATIVLFLSFPDRLSLFQKMERRHYLEGKMFMDKKSKSDWISSMCFLLHCFWWCYLTVQWTIKRTSKDFWRVPKMHNCPPSEMWEKKKWHSIGYKNGSEKKTEGEAVDFHRCSVRNRVATERMSPHDESQKWGALFPNLHD